MDDLTLRFKVRDGDYDVFSLTYEGVDYTLGLRQQFPERASVRVKGFRCNKCHWLYEEKFLPQLLDGKYT